MAQDYPYMVSNNKIKPILDAILQAAKPPKFSHEFLKKLGFNSSNDRAVIPLFRGLGFINENGVPTEHYDDLKDKNRRDHALGERLQDLYSDLYKVNTDIHSANEDDVKGTFSRITGKDAKSVARYFATFKTLASLAKFEGALKGKKKELNEPTHVEPIKSGKDTGHDTGGRAAEFHYNIQIHLPATTDLSVYNAIFKSLKDTLLA